MIATVAKNSTHASQGRFSVIFFAEFIVYKFFSCLFRSCLFVANPAPDSEEAVPLHWEHSKGCSPFRGVLRGDNPSTCGRSCEHQNFRPLHLVSDRAAVQNDSG